jgi:hypothetical protein
MPKPPAAPRRYEFWFEIPCDFDSGAKEIRIAKNLTLAQVERNKESPLFYVGSSSDTADFFIKITCSGDASLKGDDSATTAAVSILKRFLVLAQRARVLTKADAYHGLISDNGEPLDEVSCHVIDIDSPKRGFRQVNVPERMADYLRLLSFADAVVDKSRVLSKLTAASAVLDCPESVSDAVRIGTALEWEFEAAQAADETVAFVHTCIALESLLGDNAQDEPLVARLADRCAYLLGKGESEREEIRRKFRRMYTVRSKLVHGRKAKLDRQESEQLGFAKRLLRAVSDREITNLVSIHRKRLVRE